MYSTLFRAQIHGFLDIFKALLRCIIRLVTFFEILFQRVGVGAFKSTQYPWWTKSPILVHEGIKGSIMSKYRSTHGLWMPHLYHTCGCYSFWHTLFDLTDQKFRGQRWEHFKHANLCSIERVTMMSLTIGVNRVE